MIVLLVRSRFESEHELLDRGCWALSLTGVGYVAWEVDLRSCVVARGPASGQWSWPHAQI